jgi:hypothetical protein
VEFTRHTAGKSAGKAFSKSEEETLSFSKKWTAILLLISEGVFLSGCAKRYVVSVPTATPAPPSSAPTSPDCKAYRLFNAGLGYIPFDQLSGECGEAHATEAAIFLEPGMKLRLTQFTLAGEQVAEERLISPPEPLQDLHISQVPIVTQFEWIKPNLEDPLTRADYFFLTYLADASFPDNPDSIFTGCAPPGCDARAALESLKVFYGIGAQNPTPDASAAWVREILNPASYSPAHSTQFLGLSLNHETMKMFDQWDDTWFASNPIDENNKIHGKSYLYRDGYRIYAGHVLAEIEIPVELNNGQSLRYVPMYWSVEDAEKAFGLSIVGIRRKTCYLTDTFFRYLVPAAQRPELTSAAGGTSMSCTTDREAPRSRVPQTYFTLWLEKPSWKETRSASNWRAHGYVVLAKDAKKDAALILDAKRRLLLAPGDVLLVATGARTVADPGHH